MLSSFFNLLTVKTLLFGLVVGLFCYWLLRRIRYKLPPGPTPIPLIGNILQLKGRFWSEKFFEWSQKHGPVISVHMGPMRWTVLNRIDVVHEALVTKGNMFANRPKTPSTEMLSEGGKDIAFGQFGPCWRLHRKISSNALRHYMMGEHLDIRVNDAFNLVSNLIAKEKGPINPKKFVDYLIFHIFCGFCFGESYDIDDPEFVWFMDENDRLNKVLGNGLWEDIVPLLEYCPTPRFRQLERDFNIISKKVGYDRLREARKTFDPTNIRHFMDCLLKARIEAEEEDGVDAVSALTETHLAQTLMDIFFAGIDTSRFTINWALLHMAAFPEIQEKVYKEMSTVIGKGEHIKLTDRPKLSYTEAVLRESMRIGNVAPLGLFHTTSCDATVGGFDVPKGSLVAINHWALHHDPDVWEEPDRFTPERFLEERGNLAPKPTNWLPFSAGRRVCLGESVAKPELHLLFALLIQKFKISVPLGIHPDLSPDGTSFGMFPKPYKVFFELRT